MYEKLLEYQNLVNDLATCCCNLNEFLVPQKKLIYYNDINYIRFNDLNNMYTKVLNHEVNNFDCLRKKWQRKNYIRLSEITWNHVWTYKFPVLSRRINISS